MSITTVNTTVGGQAVMLQYDPALFLDGECVVYTHGSSETQDFTADSLKAGVVSAILAAGYLIACSNAHSNNWGNQSSIDDIVALIEFLRTDYDMTGYALFGQSMGGLDTLSIATEQDADLVCAVLIYPVANLAAMHALGTYAGNIDNAYPPSGDYTGYSPVTYAGADYDGLPIIWFASPDDTVVEKDDNTDQMVTLTTGHATNTVVVCSGQHGDTSHFQPTVVVDFLDEQFAPDIARFSTVFSGVIR